MKSNKIVMLGLVAAASALCLASTSASAYTACNKDGDCWHTDSRVHIPGVTLSFHNDAWWDKNKSNARYHWHDADADHDSHKGYWASGEWHSR
jgi:hypothetical protein